MKSMIAVLAAAAVIAAGARSGGDGSNGESKVGSNLVRLDGDAKRVGNGTARAYIVVDALNAPVEVGVALSEGVMENLPKSMAMDHSRPMTTEHLDMHQWILALPSKNPTPYEFVQFGWNPQGHEPPGVWDVPHFDFHFWTASLALRNSIVPSDPQYAEKAARYPADSLRAQFYLDAATAAKTTAAAMTVPEMGLHWFDVRTPEVQKMAGNPGAYRPFTTTFIYGTWDGEFVFAEPMITREYLLAKGDTTIQVPAARFAKPGYYPASYRIRWDASTREYLVSLTEFARR